MSKLHRMVVTAEIMIVVASDQKACGEYLHTGDDEKQAVLKTEIFLNSLSPIELEGGKLGHIRVHMKEAKGLGNKRDERD